MTKKDYYDILGVKKEDSPDAIKKAYKKLALKFHPDRAPEDKKKVYEETFKSMSEAYAVLSDPKKKAQYDQFGHSQFGGQYSQEDIFRGADFSNIFEELFGSGMFGGGFGRRERKRRGADLQHTVHLSFEEAVTGLEKEIHIKKHISCSACSGTGAKDGNMESCSTCGGTGQKTRTLRTPFGVMNQVTSCSACSGKGEMPKKPCADCKGNGVVKRKGNTFCSYPCRNF